MPVVELWEENPMELSFYLVDRDIKWALFGADASGGALGRESYGAQFSPGGQRDQMSSAWSRCQWWSSGKRILWSSVFTWWTERPNELCLEKMLVVELWEENPMELSFHLVDRETK
jgi:hypothetical protein